MRGKKIIGMKNSRITIWVSSILMSLKWDYHYGRGNQVNHNVSESIDA